MKKILQILALVGATLFAYDAAQGQTVSVTADLKSLFNAAQATKTQACFSLTDGNGNQLSNPRTSSGVVVGTTTQCVSPDGAGHISTSVIANDQITPANSIYTVTYMFNGRAVHGDIYQFLLADASENLNTKPPLSVIPVVAAPTGDTTYARLDGGNQPFTGAVIVPELSLGDLTTASPAFWRNPTTPAEISVGRGTSPTTPTGVGFGISSQNSDGIFMGNTGLRLGGNSFIGLQSGGVSSFATAVPDLTLSRNQAGVLQIGTTTNNSLGSLALGGAVVATTGTIRMPQGACIDVRNSGNTADQQMACSTGSNTFTFGGNQEITTSGVVLISENAAARFAIGQNPAFNSLVARSDGLFGFSSTTNPSAVADGGISRVGVKVLGIGNGSAGDVTGFIQLGGGQFTATSASGVDIAFARAGATFGSTAPLGFSAGIATAAPDSGVSRLGVGILGFGNGTQGDFSGTAKGTIFNAVTGYQINGAATANTFLKSNGTNYIAGNPILASADFANQGTTITVLHGNAAGNPAFGVVTPSDAAGNTSGSGSFALTTSPVFTTPTITSPSTTGTDSGTETLQNKRVQPRVVTVTNSTTLTPDGDNSDVSSQVNTQAAGTLTVAAPTGTPTDGQKLIIRVKSTNAQTYSFNATYRFSTTTVAPTTLAAGKTDFLGAMWNATDSKWDVVAVDQGH